MRIGTPGLVAWAAACAVALMPDAALSTGPDWPRSQETLQPGPSNAAPSLIEHSRIPPRPIQPPGPDVPAQIRGLSGRWAGWMCARRACAATLDVTSLGPSGGRLRHIIAAHDYYDYFPIDIDATLENGNELVGRWRAIWIKVRLRPDGNVDILRWWDGTPMPRSGVLSRVE